MADPKVLQISLKDSDYINIGGFTFQRQGDALVWPMHPVAPPGDVVVIQVVLEGPSDPEMNWS